MGDFQANFLRPDAGINTVEGNVAGSRAATLSKKRSIEQSLFEERKAKIRADTERGKLRIDDKFDADVGSSREERVFRSRTIGRAAHGGRGYSGRRRGGGGGGGGGHHHHDGDDNDDERTEDERRREERLKKKQKKRAMKEKKKRMAALSFAGDDEGLDDDDNDDDDADAKESVDGAATRIVVGEKERTIMKNPEVDTSFLPDRDRECRAKAERERLRAEWLNQQRSIKEEMLEVTYSYWDGTGHRRAVRCRKGDTVGKFLECARAELAREFREMTNVSSDALLYVKEDLIIPQDVSFYDLIATRARGKSGPLFNFDVHDDVRVGAVDARIEKDESHPGKVVERRWYDRNKHIFPASRWEVYDPAKEYGTYTIHGGEVNAKKKNK
ncbi:hypothetical protein ACHAW5_010839 [Stephanodiscus triporus]|uniref:FAM50A/XAP5 C-terminal domain-containing protein n=1 Tax=Stephanodiscus triporus TaxID=2934178 RepID=A0ABD3NBT6_9STRA